ncbi:hypothetical protein [Microtetraspora sp. NBRC 16547]|uniref:TetR/AcrR family transcriptional regulator n=1 Tax=Microtetraspora sp. NBRC 16547 TaxID=3030993 RepID=UPI0024A06C9C|nr:hypothetical protein [Microtetraspora sp. NBRC 16547]GLW99349.1 hypothetical protein Misp02_34360 [Microtetraspora sp. NBRC 16547]
MPVEVDQDQRLAEIARATIEVARERGPRGVTLRSVADRLGRSTAFITNYVPSRAQLMVNALERAQRNWSTERAEWLEGRSGLQRLAELARWMCTSSADDQTLRALWIEAIADVKGAARDAYEVVRSTTDSTYDEFLRSAEATAHERAKAIADILYLYCRGFHVKTVEDPQAWTGERVNHTLEYLLQVLLSSADAQVSTPPASSAVER